MSDITKRLELAENVFFTAIDGGKFKTNSVEIRFITKLDENAALNNIAFSILSAACSEYPSRLELSRCLTGLYGSSISSDVSSIGDYQLLSLGCSCIDDAFTFDGEKLTEKLIKLLLCCLFSPVAKDDIFDAELFRQLRKETVDDIEAEINDKRSWAINRAVEIAYKGQPYALNPLGTKEAALAATPAEAYAAYKRVLDTARVEIVFCGCGNADNVRTIFADAFSGRGRAMATPDFPVDFEAKKEIELVTEPMDVQQSKLVMIYKSDCDDDCAMRFMNCILGATPFSKLFVNVREKLSLCYYCSSRFNKYKGYLRIDSGVNTENIETARVEIARQLSDIANGSFTDDDMNNSLLSILDSLNSIGDTPGGLVHWYFHSFVGGGAQSPQQEAEDFRSVTRERIINAAKSLIPDTVYIMQAEENTEENE